MRVRGKHEYDLIPSVNSGDNLAGVHVTTADPTTSDDASLGYYEGYIWVATTSNNTFICEDATETSPVSAVWTQIDGAAGGGMVSGISKNSGADVNAADRSTLNFIEGTNITLTIADDAGGDEVDITIDAAGGGASWTKVTKTHSDFTDAATTSTIELFSLAAGTILKGVVLKHTTAFAGTSWTAATLSVGITGELERYMEEFDVFQTVGDTTFSMAQNFDIQNWGSATSIKLNLETIGGNANVSSAGAVEVYYLTETVKS